MSGFGFGIEAEYLILEKSSFRPLWINDFTSSALENIIKCIHTQDISMDGLNKKPLHESWTHYLIEGYTITDEALNPIRLLPKGIESRTPIAHSIEAAVRTNITLHNRLADELHRNNLSTAIISHHPTECEFNAPRNYSRDDYWNWARVVTATYGPDFNISVPSELSNRLDLDILSGKINYYMPAAIALSFFSPLFQGSLWRPAEAPSRIGKSIRTYRRSDYAPIYYIHEKPSLRFEFKGFEMSRDPGDYHAYILICLGILLDQVFENRLQLLATDEQRIADLKELAIFGLEQTSTRERATLLLDVARLTAEKLGFSSSPLANLQHRIDTRRVPADRIIDTFMETQSISATMKTLQGYCGSVPEALCSGTGASPTSTSAGLPGDSP